MATTIPLLLMGCGGVGRKLLHHIISCRPLHSRQGVRLKVVGVCDSKSMVAVPDVLISEFHDDFLLKLCKGKSSGSTLQEIADIGQCQVFSGPEIGSRVVDFAAALRKSGLALVDCSASSGTVDLLSEVVNLDSCVVLANKKPLTSSLEYYDKLVSQPRRIRHESTVGAGLPVISTINRLLSSGDPIFRIIGSLSGTLGYVMSEVESGRPFSQVVNSAKSLGFTEPGADSVRLLGHRIELESIKVESLFPEEMKPGVMPLEEFLVNGLPLLDKDIQKRIENAASNGNVLRYVCLIEESRCEVGIQEVAKDSALGRLKGSDNVLEIYSRCYSKQPLVIQGAGAGNDTTAAGVLADILDLQDLFRHTT